MANKVFLSFRFEDGNEYKEDLTELFAQDIEIINCSEDKDRSDMSDETIKKYLYEKLKRTSVTIVLLTPKAIKHNKNIYGYYDDWIYDEVRYSLEDRENNRCNGLIAVYVPEAEPGIIVKTECNNCERNCKITSVYDFENLVRKNMMNVLDIYKTHACEGKYDSNYDSYCSLILYDDFKNHYQKYISIADEKRNYTNKYDIWKDLNKR